MDLYPTLSPYLKNAVFNERTDDWQDPQSIYPETTTVGCYPLNKMFPETIASSRFENLGIPIGLIYYNTRPAGYFTRFTGGEKERHKNDHYRDDDDDDCGDDCENENEKHSLNMMGGGVDFDKLVKDVVEEKDHSEKEKINEKKHNTTRKNKKV